MTGKYFKENTNCIYQEAENIKQCFLLVTVKEHDKFIVIYFTVIIYSTHSGHIGTMVVTSSRARYIFTKTSNITALSRKEMPIIPGKTRVTERFMIYSLWLDNFSNEVNCIVSIVIGDR